MLTPADLRSHRFVSTVRGSYRADEVDAYFAEVVESYEQVFRDNADLKNKIGILAERVEAYKEDEEIIKATLVTAQRAADTLTKEAEEKSSAMLESASTTLETARAEAQAEADKILEQAQAKALAVKFESEEKAQTLLSDAASEARQTVETARREAAQELERIQDEIDRESLALEVIKKEAAEFKNSLLEQFKRQVDFIETLPGVVAQSYVADSEERPEDNFEQAVAEVAGEPDDEVQPVAEADDEEEPEVLGNSRPSPTFFFADEPAEQEDVPADEVEEAVE